MICVIRLKRRKKRLIFAFKEVILIGNVLALLTRIHSVTALQALIQAF